jgi:hypothetical protein
VKLNHRALFFVIVLIIILLMVLGSKIFGTGYTSAITDKNGKTIPGSIASLEKVNLGGMEQSILFRGYNKDNPILLWLHGGPAFSQMPIAHHYDETYHSILGIYM